MFYVFMLILCTNFCRRVSCNSPCIKGATFLHKSPVVQVSPCHITFDNPGKPTKGPTEANHSASALLHAIRLTRAVKKVHGFPAIFAASRVYVSTNRFLDHPACLTEDLLPSKLSSEPLTGAGLSRNFLFMLFGRRVMRVPTSLMLRWLAGDLSPQVLDVRSFPEDAPAPSRLVTAPCCDDTQWCAKSNSHLVAYSPEVRDRAVILLASWDDGDSYRQHPVNVPADSEPLLFAQYPSEAHGTLFFNHKGKGLAARMLRKCHFLPEGTAAGHQNGPGCQEAALQLSDRPIRAVLVQPTMRMLTVLVTEINRLLISGRADTFFQTATVLDATSLEELEGEGEAVLPLTAFATDGERWMLIDAKQSLLLGSALDVWTSRVIHIRLKNITSDSIAPDLAIPKSLPNEKNASFTQEGRFGSINATGSTKQHQVFLLRGRTVEILSLAEPGGAERLSCSLRRVSLQRHLAALDARCGVLQLTAVSRGRLEPMVDKSDTLLLDVRLVAESRLAVRPLVLLSSSALVSETRLLASRARPDGAVSSRWLVAVRSHPELRRRPFLRQLRLAQLHVTTTVQQPECPARLPRAVPLFIGCSPWLRLVARNKRVDADTCRQLQAAELRVASSPDRDPLLRYQQRLRGETAVRLQDGEWRVRWDPAWGCPLLSSEKAGFTPVLAVKSGDQLLPLRQATVLYEIHGVHDFGFSLTAATVGCRRHDLAESVSWRRTYARFLQHGNLSSDFDPTTVLNTASYVSCNHTTRPAHLSGSDPELSAQAAQNISYELFGLPDHANSILWVESAKIHVFNFRVVDPLFTYCDLNLTVAVFFMHSSDVKQQTKMVILLVGVGLSLLAVVLAHVSQQVMQRLRKEKQHQLDQLLTAADAFVDAAEARHLPLVQELPPLDLARGSGHK